MPDRPHLAFPPRLTTTGFAMVEQGSPEHTQQRAALVLATVTGDLVALPDLGIPEQAFTGAGEDLPEIAAALDRWVPTGDTAVRDELVARARTIIATARSAS